VGFVDWNSCRAEDGRNAKRMQFRSVNPNTVVSSQLLNFLLHSLSHSLILDPKDLLTWEGVFSKQEPEEVRAHENPSFEKAPKHTLNIDPKHLVSYMPLFFK
jgi:hypothetical protein